MFQNAAAQNQAFYPPQSVSPYYAPPNPADRGLTPSSVGTGTPVTSYQPQYANVQQPIVATSHEMPASWSTARLGWIRRDVELAIFCIFLRCPMGRAPCMGSALKIVWCII